MQNITKTQQILSQIEDGEIITKLSKRTDISYPHTINLVSELKKLNLIKTKKVGRTIQVFLTKNGKKAKVYAKGLIKLIGGKKQ